MEPVPQASASRFGERLRLVMTRDATALAADLFRARFRKPFPTPHDRGTLPFATPVDDWWQIVAQYDWPDGRRETVGFCNWVRYGETYLAGGLCVRESFYRRLPKADFTECRRRGGIAQIILNVSRRALTDAKALFGYVGDKKSMAVSLRCGYERTEHPHLIVNWVQDLDPEDKARLVGAVAAIGPF